LSRDYSQFLPTGPKTKVERTALEKLGWQPFFTQQTVEEDLDETPPVRVVEIHRSGLRVLGDGIDTVIPPAAEATIGDWLLLNQELPTHSQILDRKSLFQRRAPGHDRSLQKIAANVDTAFIVSSCNQDFNVARIERYLALAFEADVVPVIVLTKADLCDDTTAYLDDAIAISKRVPVIMLNALSDEALEKLSDWCKPSQTVAFLGSSGVGKSTLVNALFGVEVADTGGIRSDDAKGRHTTTHRHLHFTPEGCCVLDTPGMRELQLADAESGIAELFDDLNELASQCRFRDCKHDTEPGCAVLKSIEQGELDASRLDRWRKLEAEDRFNSASLAQRRATSKSFGKMVKTAVKQKKR
jgi:ribosome biogenesis GTPase / thiamine phosphate phosphatase